jgi:hypothetical protein
MKIANIIPEKNNILWLRPDQGSADPIPLRSRCSEPQNITLVHGFIDGSNF